MRATPAGGCRRITACLSLVCCPTAERFFAISYGARKRATPAGDCSPIRVLRCFRVSKVVRIGRQSSGHFASDATSFCTGKTHRFMRKKFFGKREKNFKNLLTNQSFCVIVLTVPIRLQSVIIMFDIRRSTQVGRRGAPAKGVGR